MGEFSDIKKTVNDEVNNKELHEHFVDKVEELGSTGLNKAEALKTHQTNISGVESERIDETINLNQPNVAVGEDAYKIERELRQSKEKNEAEEKDK